MNYVSVDTTIRTDSLSGEEIGIWAMRDNHVVLTNTSAVALYSKDVSDWHDQ